MLAILSSMPELHVLNMTNNHIQQTTGGVKTSSINATVLRRVQEKHDLQLPQADLPGLTTDPAKGQGGHWGLEEGKAVV